MEWAGVDLKVKIALQPALQGTRATVVALLSFCSPREPAVALFPGSHWKAMQLVAATGR